MLINKGDKKKFKNLKRRYGFKRNKTYIGIVTRVFDGTVIFITKNEYGMETVCLCYKRAKYMPNTRTLWRLVG